MLWIFEICGFLLREVYPATLVCKHWYRATLQQDKICNFLGPLIYTMINSFFLQVNLAPFRRGLHSVIITINLMQKKKLTKIINWFSLCSRALQKGARFTCKKTNHGINEVSQDIVLLWTCRESVLADFLICCIAKFDRKKSKFVPFSLAHHLGLLTTIT